MTNPFRDLFDYDRPETSGEIIFFKLFELFIIVFTVHLAWTWGLYIPRIEDIVLPLGIAQYLDVSFMYDSPLPLLNAGLISLCVLLGFFRIARWAYFAAFLLLHFQFVTRFTLGAIPHSSNMLGMTLLGLALAMLLFEDALHRRRFTLGFTYFFVGLGYTLAGVSKLVGTGIFWSDGRHLWMWINEKSIDVLAKTGLLEYNWLQEAALSDHGLATVFLTLGLLTELGGFLMWWRRLRTPVILALLGLHLSIWIVMEILFTLSIYELLLLGLPWAAWISRVRLHTALDPVFEPLHRVSRQFA